MLNVLNLNSQPAPAPAYTNNVGATPEAPPPSSSYGVPRGGRITSQTFTRQPTSQTFTRQPINGQISRRPKTSLRQQPPRFIQNPRPQVQFQRGQFQG